MPDENHPTLDLRALEAHWRERWGGKGAPAADPERPCAKSKSDPKSPPNAPATIESPPGAAPAPTSAEAPSGSDEGERGAADSDSRKGTGDRKRRDGGRRRRREGDRPRRPYYLLDMFPYPSLEGFSVNQLRGIAITDVLARFQECRGRTVFRPVGWDSFGLSLEQEAAKENLSPPQLVDRGVALMREQLAAFGARVDWEAELRTSDPQFYRWTQWIFLRMMERDLAVRQEISLRWCPKCRTNLASEESVEGRCVHCNSEAEDRETPQWILKITEFADRLHKGLRHLSWPPRVRSMQRNWIGRKQGFRVTLKATSEFSYDLEEFEVFVRNSERIPGATFVLLSPEHPSIEPITDELYREDVQAYCEEARRFSERERMALGTLDGVPTGAYALNPVTLREMPIWVSKLVLPTVGFGAVLGVPGHNERHKQFAEEHKLSIRTVVAPRRGPPKKKKSGEARKPEDDLVLVNSGPLTGVPVPEARRRIVQTLEGRGIAAANVQYNLRDWIFARQRFWGEPIPIVHCDECGIVPVPDEDLPVLLPQVDAIPSGDGGRSPLEALDAWVETECPKCKGPGRRETDTMPQWAGSCWYYLRYLSPGHTEGPFDADEARRKLPVDHCVGGIEHAILHLLYVRFFSYFLHDLKLVGKEEPFRKLFNQGRFYSKAPEQDVAKIATHRGDRIPAGPYLERFGADALRLHLYFLGPPESDVVWSEEGLPGCSRFLRRAYHTIIDRSEKGKFVSRRVLVAKHHLIRRVTRAIKTVRLNKAVSAFMEFIKILRGDDLTPEEVDKATLKTFTVLLAPFCPHVASELWSRIGGDGSVFDQEWPEFSPELLKPTEVEVAVMVNERIRDRLVIDTQLPKAQLIEMVMQRPRIQRVVGDRTPTHTYVIPDRLIKLRFEDPPEEKPVAEEPST